MHSESLLANSSERFLSGLGVHRTLVYIFFFCFHHCNNITNSSPNFLGSIIDQSNDGLVILQRKYVTDILEKIC